MGHFSKKEWNLSQEKSNLICGIDFQQCNSTGFSYLPKVQKVFGLERVLKEPFAVKV